MENKRFAKNDEGFICSHCGKTVLPLKKTSRDHCPFCLWSLHLDVLPGDRANECKGEMKPFFAEPDPRKGFIIYYRCQKCGQTHRNRSTPDGVDQPDDKDLLIQLTTGQYM